MNKFVNQKDARQAAFQQVQMLMTKYGYLTSKDLIEGFKYMGYSVRLNAPQRGIWKPRSFSELLSIQTIYSKTGRGQYQDQHTNPEGIRSGNVIEYSFMGHDEDDYQRPANQQLLQACNNKTKVLYFIGIAPQKFLPFITLLSGWNREKKKIDVGIFDDFQSKNILLDTYHDIDYDIKKRYAPYMVKQRLHQGSFRVALLDAYNCKCALSKLPEPQLLDAAHIIPDKDVKYGSADVENGILLSKTHHAAFDAHLLGIDRDYNIHISKRLMDLKDGPILEALRSLDNVKIPSLPRSSKDYPSQDRLAERFKVYRQHNLN